MPGPINMVKEGRTITVSDPNEIAAAYDQGWAPETPTEHAADVAAQVQTEQYGGPVGKVAAVGTGALRTVTGGLSDVALGALGGREDLAALRQENPISSTVGEVGGAFLPIGAAAAIGRAGKAVSALGEGAGVAGKIGAAVAGGAVEGGLFGAGQGVSELALSKDPLTVERLASTLSSSALYGAAFGAGIGGLGKAAELGLTRAKGAIDSALERQAAKAKTPAEAIESGDLSLLDKRMLDAAEKGETERIFKETAPQRRALVDELDTYRNLNRDSHKLREVTVGSGDPNIREAGAAFVNNDIKLRRLLDDRVGLADNPQSAQVLLRKQRQALEEIGGWAQGQKQLWEADVAAAPTKIREQILAREVPGELGPFTESGLDLAVDRVLKERQGYQWNGAIKGGLKEPAAIALQPQFEKVLAWNQKFQTQLEQLAKPPTSDLLAKIADARAVLEAPKAPSLGQAVLNAAAPFAGPLGVAAAAGNRALGGFRKVIEAAGTKAGQAVSTFLGPAIKVTKYAPPLATKVLASIRFGERDKAAPEPKTLPELYKARTDEIKNQIHIAADGSYQMRPAARMKLAARFDGIRAADPQLADQLETAGARRIEYLASIMPRLPDYGTPQVGPERRVVPDLQMRAWARAAAAVEDPHAVLDRAAQGRVTPAEAAAIKAVYPELLASFTNEVAGKLPTLQKTLGREKQFALSVLTGVPVDPAMTPGIQRVIQGMYASEPGTERGTQAPVPEPQFGSVKADPGTKAQQRQGENA